MPAAPRRRDHPGANPVRWLLRLHPLHSWLIVMAVIIGLSMVGLRPLALLLAVVWLAYAVFTWVAPSLRRPGRPRR